MKTYPDSANPIARFALLLMLLLAVVALAACGGDDAPENADLPTAAAPAATEEVVEEAPDEPTDTPPTAEPTAEPTLPPPTEAPEEPAFATGECGNAFYPVVEGRALTYATTGSDVGDSQYTTIFSNVTDSSFTLTTDVDEDTVFATDWQCSADGLLAPEFSQMPGDMAGMEIEFVEATGFTIPAEEMFQVGESWPTHYVANATVGVSDTESMTMVQTFDMTNTVTGVEAVSVPAGDYPEAVVVETVADITVSMMILGVEQAAPSLSLNYKSWYVEGVGLVRQEFTDLFGDTTGEYATELVDIQ